MFRMRTSISIPKDQMVVVPIVSYRTTSYRDTRNSDYTNWHRLSSRDDWTRLFVHTFNELVSPSQYGKTHPEYFSLVDGNSATGHAAMPLQPREYFLCADRQFERKDGQRSRAPTIGRSVRTTTISIAAADLAANST